MHIISKQKVKIGDVVVEPNKVTFLPDTAKEDHYFKLCLKSEYFQVIEEQKEEEKPKKAKKEA
jgi:uncharacterized protein YxeA